MVTLDDGSKAIFKPDSGEPEEEYRNEIMVGHQTEREAGAWEVAKLGGVDDLVAPTVIREIDGERGALMEFQDGTVAHNIYGDARYDSDHDLARAAAFDFVIGNEDRHAGNWLVSDSGKLRLIDHGLSFPDQGQYSPTHNNFLMDHASDDFPPNEFADLYVSHEDKIAAKLEEIGLPKASIIQVRDRIQRLSAADSWSTLLNPDYNVHYPDGRRVRNEWNPR